mmetsp:Transcript_16165/g.40248  ORF Transcript_16165/g.40248 Transcript_16165/m.40248 type:complete len:1228 (-) Transcript_16165:317-4000(-)
MPHSHQGTHVIHIGTRTAGCLHSPSYLYAPAALTDATCTLPAPAHHTATRHTSVRSVRRHVAAPAALRAAQARLLRGRAVHLARLVPGRRQRRVAQGAGAGRPYLRGHHGVLARLAAEVSAVLDDLAAGHAHLVALPHQVLQQRVHRGVARRLRALGLAARRLLARLAQRARVHGRVLQEDGHGQVAVLVARVRGDGGHGLQLDERLGALAVELVVEGRQRQEGVDLLGVQQVLVVAQVQRGAHGQVHVAAVQLAVRQQPEVVRLRAAPRAVDTATQPRHGGRLQRHQAGQRLRGGGLHGGGGLARAARHHGALGRRGGRVQRPLLELVHLERGQHVQLLDAQRVHLLGRAGLRQVGQQLGGLHVVVGLAVQLNRLQELLLLQQVVGVLGQQRLDLREVVRLRQRHRLVPLVEQVAAVDGLLGVAALEEGGHALVAQPHALELLADGKQQRRPLGQRVHQPPQRHKVLERVEALHQHIAVLGLRVELRGLAPLVAVAVVLPDLVPRVDQLRVVAAHLAHKLLHLEPVAQPHAHVHRQVGPVHLVVQLLRLVKALEVHRDLGALLGAVVQLLQVLHKLDALVVCAAHKRLVRHHKVQPLQRVLRQDAPQARVAVAVHKRVRVLARRALEQLARVAQAARLVHDHELHVGLVGLLHDVVHEHARYLQVVEVAQVRGRRDGLLGVQPAEDVHARLLHHGKQLGVVVRPPHVPRVLALKGQVLALRGARVALGGEVVEGQHAVDVDDGHLGHVAVERQHVGAAAQQVLPLHREVRQAVALHHAAHAPDHEHRVVGAHGGDEVGRGLCGRLVALGRHLRGVGVVHVEHLLAHVTPLDAAHVRGQHLGEGGAELPHVHRVVAGGNDVVVGDGQVLGLHLYVLAVHRRADGVAQDEDVLARVLALGGQHAKVAKRLDGHQLAHVLGVLVVVLGVPEHDAVLRAVGAVERVHKRVAEVAPLVVGAHVGKVHERVHRQRQAQPVALPAQSADAAAGHAQRAQVLAHVVVELHHPQLARLGRVAAELVARHRQHGAVAVPLALAGLDARVDAHRVVVRLVAHELHAPVVQADGQHRAVGLRKAQDAVIPLHAHHLALAHVPLVAVEGHLGHGVAVAVVHVALALRCAEQDEPPVRRPLHQGQRQPDLLAPQPVAVHAAHDHRAVLVHDADLLAVGRPLHVAHHRLVAVVDHLLEPHALVQHPHNDEPALITGGELLERIIPAHTQHCAIVPLQGLVQ